MKKIKSTIKKSSADLTKEKLLDKNKKINDLAKVAQSSLTIKEMNDEKLVNTSFKNVHTSPANEQQFSNNI